MVDNHLLYFDLVKMHWWSCSVRGITVYYRLCGRLQRGGPRNVTETYMPLYDGR